MEFPAKNKYYSMVRAYSRLKKLCTDSGKNVTNTEAKDAAEDFFNQCYHLKDWLKKDPGVKLSENVEDFVHKRSNALCLAGVYCNSLKHGGLRIYAPGQELDRVLTHVYLLQQTSKGFVNYSRVEIQFDGRKYDAFDLATECMQEWQEFLRANNVEFDPP